MLSFKKKYFFTLAFFLSALSFSFSAKAQKENEYKNRLKQIEADQQKLQSELSSIKNKKTGSLDKIDLLERKITLNHREIESIQEFISQKEKEIYLKKEEHSALEAKKELLKREYAKTISRGQKFTNKESLTIYLVSAENMNQSIRRARYIKEYNKARRKLYGELQQLTKSMERNIAQIEQFIESKEKLFVNLRLSQNRNFREKNDLDVYISSLKKQEKNTFQLLKKKEKEKKLFEKKLAEEIKRIASSKKKRNQSQIDVDAQLSKKFLTRKGSLKLPVKSGLITNSYGTYSHPLHRDVKLKNNGVDILAKETKSVHSIYNGKVTTILTITPPYKTIIVRHGDYLSVYANIAQSNVKKGQLVQEGQKLGSLDSSEKKPSVHFEIWYKQKTLNPEQWVQ